MHHNSSRSLSNLTASRSEMLLFEACPSQRPSECVSRQAAWYSFISVQRIDAKYNRLTIRLVLRNYASFVGLCCDPALVVLDRTVEMLNRAIVADPQACAYVLQHSDVVTDHQHTTLEFL